MTADVTPNRKLTLGSLVGEIGTVEGTVPYTDIASAVGALADYRLHKYLTVVCEFQYSRESFALLRHEAIEHDAAVGKQFCNLIVRHLAIAENAVDVKVAGRIVSDAVLATESLAGLHHVSATLGATANDFL